MKLEEDTVEALKKLNHVCQSRGINLTLIGASVLIVCVQVKVIPSTAIQATRDIDAIISASSWHDYHEFVELLIQHGFERRPHAPEYKLFYKTAEIDILPYGEDLIKGQYLVWPEAETHMNVTGLREALAFSSPIQLDHDLEIPVAPLWLLVYLKIISYLDRPNERARDIKDIVTVLEHYESQPDYTSRRFDIHEDGIDYELSGAFLIGQDIRNYLSLEMLDPIVQLFDLIENKSAEIERVLGYGLFNNDKAFKLFEAMRRGLGIGAASK